METMPPQEARRINVFFYGLFMDESLLQSKGILPRNICLAKLYGYSLRIGERATLLQDSSFHVFGVLMSLTHKEIDSLYSDDTLQAYRPEPVITNTNDGRILPALCFNLVEPAPNKESNQAYAAKLKSLAVELGFPEEYTCSIR